MSSHAAARSLIAALVLAAGSVVAPAATLTWDANGTTAGVTDGAGAWFTANRWWDGSSTTTWTSGNDAVFGVGGTGGAVTLSATTSVASLTFNTFAGTYTLGTTGTTLTVDAGGLTMNSGSGTVSIISPVALGAAQSWTNNKATTLTVSGIVGNGGNTLTVSGSGPSTLSGAISGAGGLTKSGDGLLILSAANTYTGLTTVSGGVLRLSSATALPGGINATGGVSALTLNGGVLELGQGNFLRNLGSGTGQFQITGGTSGFSAFGAGRAVTVNNNAAAAVTWGSAEFNPATFVLNESTANSPITFSNPINLNGATRTVAVNANTATLSGVLSGADAGLTKVGVGMLALSGNNTYAGSTQINAGTLQFVTPASLYGGVTANWTAANVVTGSGATLAVRVGASNFTAGNVTTLLTNLGGLGGSVADNGLKAGSSIGFDTSSAGGSFTVADSIADSTGTGGGAIGLVKLGSGTLTLPGSNAYTGPTQINAGVLTAGNASALGSGTIRFGGGTYQYTAATAGQDWSGRFKGSTSSISLDTNAQNVTLAGGIDSTNVGGLTKLGTGTLTLSGSNTYSGATTVSAGELHLLNGSFNNVSSLVPSAGATVRLTNAIVTNTTASSVFINGTFIQESGTYTADSGSADTYVAGLYRMEGGYLRLASGPYVSGTFNQTGGTVDMTRSSVILQMGGVAGITAEYAISGGTLNATTVNGSLRIGNGAAGTGRMTIQSAAVVNALTINFGSGATAAGVGILNLEGGVLRVNTVTNSGTGAAHQFNFSGGTLSPYSANSTIGSLTAINNTTVTLSGTTATMSSNDKDGIGRTVTVYSNLTGAGALTFIGTGTHTLSGSNTYAGSTQINAGIVSANNASALGSGTIGFGGGTLRYNAASAGQDWSGRFKDSTSSIALDTNAQNVTLAGAIDSTNVGGLTKLGSGTLTLSAANTYSGATTISAGSLVLGNASALGAGSGNLVVSSAVLDLGGYSITRSGTVSVVGSTLQNGTITNNTVAFDAQSGTASAILAGSAGLTKTTSGTLTLSGANTYSGATTISAGMLTANNASALGSGTIGFGGGTLQYTAASAGQDWSGRFRNSTSSIALDTNAQNVTLAGEIDSTNVGGLTKLGSGTLTLSAANTYSGATTISAGSLVLGNASALGAESGDVMVSSGVLDLGGYSVTRSGTVSVVGSTLQNGTITNNNGAFDVRSGTASAILAGSAGLTKTTSGTLRLSGANTYSGATTISAGSLVLANASALGAGSGNLVVSGGVLDLGGYSVTRTGTVSFTGGTVQSGTITNNTVAYDIQSGSASAGSGLGGSAGLIKSGEGTMTLRGTVLYTGETTVNGGQLVFDGSAQKTNAVVTINNGGTMTLISNAALSNGTVTVNAGGLLYVNSNTNNNSTFSTLTLNGGTVSSTNGGRVHNAGAIRAGGSTTSTITSAVGNSTSGFTYNMYVEPSSTLLISGQVQLGAPTNIKLTKYEAGTLILSASNAYNGLTTVSAGILNIRNSNALGTTAVGTTVTTNAALEVQGDITVGAEALTLNGSGISSGGALRNISDSNTYGGAITLGSAARINSDAGTLTLDVASGNAIAGAHNLTFGGGGNITVADAIATSTGGLTKDGAGTLTLSASNAYQGGTTINFGTLRAEHANAFGAGAIVLASNASLDLNNLAVANAITNNGGAISGLAGYAGTQNVLGLTALTGTVGGTVNVGIGGTLKGTNTGFTGAVTIANGGIHSPGNSPGVQTFENGISYDAGSTLIWELVANTTSNPGTAFDLVNVTGGNLAIADGALLQLEFQNTGLVSSAVDWSNTFWDVAQSWTIIDFSGGGNSSGNFTLLGSGTSWLDSTGASLATARNGASFQVSKFNNDVVLSYVIVVPEPGTLALAGIGVAVAGALFVRRRRG